MRSGALSTLVKLSLERDRRAALSSIFGICIGVGSLVFFVSLGLGVGRVVREKVFAVDTRLVEVIPPQVSLGGILGGKLDDASVARLRALPGVTAAYRKMSLRVPAVSRYNGDFFGAKLYMGIEVLGVGVDPELVKGDVQLGDFKDPGPNQPIPAIAATRLLEIYNKTFAPQRRLPQLSPQMVVGFTFPIELGRSFVTQMQVGPTTQGQMQLVGVSDRGLLAGVTLPLQTVIRLNKAAGVDFESYSSVAVMAESPGEVPGLVAKVKEMGFGVDDQERNYAERAGMAVAVTTSAMALLSALICLLAALNIAHALSASVRVRAKELGVMRAVGASRADIRALVLGEAAVLGLGGGVLGTVLAVLATVVIDLSVRRFVPDFPFKPETFFALPWFVPLLGLSLGVVSAVAGAFLPARQAAAMDPARTLAG